ncbi:hypothetical protein B0H11DRAFT_2291372 [Mycena galericulata]|nr:hypothetical protein B0H11DRAFT_2291372 [Mycena galericulata]
MPAGFRPPTHPTFQHTPQTQAHPQHTDPAASTTHPAPPASTPYPEYASPPPSRYEASSLKIWSAAAYFVLGGYDTYGPGSLDFLMHRKTVQEIETAYPHGNLATEGAEVLTREGVTKPDCLLSHWPGGIEGLFKMVLKANRIVGQ